MLKVHSEADQVSIAKVHEAGQEHIFTWWDDLNSEEQRNLIDQVRKTDFQLLNKLVMEYVKPSTANPKNVGFPSPAEVVPIPGSPGEQAEYSRCRALGEECLRAGRLGLFMAAGGVGNRLGWDQPHGLIPIGPVSGKSIFQLHADKVRAIGRRYRTSVPWFVMTSGANHEQTVGFFEDNGYFGLPRSDVHFVPQVMLPAVDRRGKILMASKGKMAMSPNGHGGAIALMQEGVVREIVRERGIQHLFYFQVDNPMVRIADPPFIGYHLQAEADTSSKAVRKIEPDERVGVFCKLNGHVGVIEYSELPAEERSRRDGEGNLSFWAGNIATHAFSVSFLDRIREAGFNLPYHLTPARTPYLDGQGRLVTPNAGSSMKFELFIFDVVPLAERPLILEVDRQDEFSPVKNDRAPDSPDTARQALSNLFARWMRDAGAEMPFDADGNVIGNVEISPLFALDEGELASRLNHPIEFNGSILLE